MSTSDDSPIDLDDARVLRVAYPCGPTLRAKAEWALEALMARRRVRDWVLVAGGEDADLELAHDASSWQFSQDAAPDPARDPLAATFWWLARVEERHVDEAHFDEHGRFRFEGSAMQRSRDPFATPVDDIANALAVPASRGDDSRRAIDQGPPWRLVATHDIDQPWRWTARGKRRAMRAIRDHARAGRFGAACTMFGALLASGLWWKPKRDDPWCNAERIHVLEQRHHARSTSYVMVDARVPADGDLDMHERGGPVYVARLTAPQRSRRGRGRHAAGGVVGLHGSYTVLHEAGRLKEERAVAERLAGAPVTDHRFHYLRHQPVRDWPKLAAAGLTSDSSLGYAEQPGFRAGTAHPFRAWDHERDEPLDLVIIPLAFMDASLEERYLDLDPINGGRDILDELLDTLERTGGSSSVLWHNDKLCTVDSRRWTRLYRYLLAAAERRGGLVTTAAEAALAYRALLPEHRRGN